MTLPTQHSFLLEELLLLVAAKICRDDGDGAFKANLLACTRVSKLWRRVFTPFLWKVFDGIEVGRRVQNSTVYGNSRYIEVLCISSHTTLDLRRLSCPRLTHFVYNISTSMAHTLVRRQRDEQLGVFVQNHADHLETMTLRGWSLEATTWASAALAYNLRDLTIERSAINTEMSDVLEQNSTTFQENFLLAITETFPRLDSLTFRQCTFCFEAPIVLTNIGTLRLEDCNLGTAVNHLSSFLRNFPKLHTLSIQGNSYTTFGECNWYELEQSLRYNCTALENLVDMDIRTPIGASAHGESVYYSKSLEQIVTLILTSLKSLKKFTCTPEFKFSFGREHLRLLVDPRHHSETLETLRLPGCRVNGRFAAKKQPVVSLVTHCPKLRHLELPWKCLQVCLANSEAPLADAAWACERTIESIEFTHGYPGIVRAFERSQYLCAQQQKEQEQRKQDKVDTYSFPSTYGDKQQRVQNVVKGSSPLAPHYEALARQFAACPRLSRVHVGGIPPAQTKAKAKNRLKWPYGM